MYKPDILDEIIDELNAEQVPAEFILMAKVRTYDGRESIVTGEEYEEFMLTNADKVVDARLILDVKLIRQVIVTETNAILAAAAVW